MVTDATQVANANAQEPEDVKPVMPRQFPMGSPDTPRSQGQNRPEVRASTSTSISPARRIKRELSPISVLSRLPVNKQSPIYISSDDEDEDEVDAQIKATQSASAHSEEQAMGTDKEEQGDEDEDEDEGEETDDERNTPSEKPPAKDEQHKEKGALRVKGERDESTALEVGNEGTEAFQEGEETPKDQENGEDGEGREDEEDRDTGKGQEKELHVEQSEEQSPKHEAEDSEEDELDDDAEGTKMLEDQESAEEDDVNSQPEVAAEQQMDSRKSSSRSSSEDSSPPSSSPMPTTLLRSPSIPRPRPRPKVPSLSQPPADVKKRRLPSNLPPATQPAASSSRGAQSRASAASGSHSSLTIGNTEAIDLSEEDDKRYAKRPKTTSVGPGRSKYRRMHPDYWLLDGSVILQVEDTLFKLHRSRLVTQSTYFQELFSANPEALDEAVVSRLGEEWVYIIKGVSMNDFQELLVALDNAISYVYEPPSFSRLAAILRAAQTLRVTALEDFVVRTLRGMWPQELSKLTGTRIPHASETIILARKCDLPDILKRAFYELVRTARLGEDEDADTEDPDVAGAQVSRQDLARLIKAREELVSRWILSAGSPPDIACGQDHATPLDRAKLLEYWHTNVRRDLFEECLYDPLVGLQRLVAIDWERLGYCPGCAKAWRDSWQAQRVKLWQQLDLWLGLPTEEGK